MKKKRIFMFVASICFGLLLNAQVPQLIDYQGMARDGSGTPISSQVISVKIEVVKGPLPGTVSYSEVHFPMTNAYGLFSLMIGDGSVISGNFSSIGWSTGDYFIHTYIDPAGGASYVDMGLSKLATVPFAFYAANAGGGGGSSPWLSNPPNIYFNTGFVGIGTDSPADYLHINNDAGNANAIITSDQSYYIADASGNSGLWMQEGGSDVAWLYWNPFSQAVFMYENGDQTMAWKGNKVGVGTIEPLVKMQVVEENSAGAYGADLNIYYSPSQNLAPAILGWSENNTSDISYGVFGHSYSTGSSFNEGVFGEGSGGTVNNYGVYAVAYGEAGSSYSIAVYGDDDGSATNNYAGYFVGDVEISGTLSKSGGSFKIDHPQDPANKYLVHSFVESPDMMNIYNGNVTTDGAGIAEVELPSYFSALNMDFRYQLTVIGQFAQAIVKEEISGNHFSIQTDKPNVKVSWQVTGVRNDAWAKANRIIPEIDKPANEKGLYKHPELFGKSSDLGLKTGVPHNSSQSSKVRTVKEKDDRTQPDHQ
ncbi:MAG TPA: hypothetical protein VK994_03215 [Bacteroidales bacterium]|nr:hypothetical protein [Bacteroidales bacterium]